MRTGIFGKAIRQARIKEGLTQEDLATKSGISQTRVSRIENGHELPPVDIACNLIATLNMPELQAKYCLSCPMVELGHRMQPEPTTAAMHWLLEKMKADLTLLDQSAKENDTKAFTDRCYQLHSALDTMLGGMTET